jgi:NAD(P)-dependent dehydrogenase (short-subunit alcohol dehydrogenase family)
MKFDSEGYAVALLSRSIEFSAKLAGQLSDARVYSCDATDPDEVTKVLGEVAAHLGPTDVLLYNAGSGVFGTFEDVEAADLEQSWRVNTLGLFAAARAVTPAMKDKGSGAIIVTGATASLRGGARFAAFAQAKAAQRNLVQSMARHLWPQGIHVALMIIDGMIDLPRTRQRLPDAPNEKFLSPDAIAEAAWGLVSQHPSAWTSELDLRPHVESW